MKASRTAYAAKNFAWSMVGNVSNSILGFVSRTIFIYTLGTVYLGVNGLFTNILGMLSFAELGIGSAITFSLYKPLSENNIPKLQAIINFYRTAYRIIAAVVACIGVALIPFLKYIVKGADGIDNIGLIYCLFLINTVSSYLITYKTTIISADQKSYLLANINIISKVVITLMQIIVMVLTKNFIAYLITGILMQIVTKFYLNYFTDKKYPYIKGRNDQRLSKEEKGVIFTKVKALIVHKIGEISIYQTDNIITSAFINVSIVGLVSNFTMIISLINGFVTSFFNSASAGLGNLVATETYKKRYEVFKVYDFLCFWLFGWTGLCLYFLLSPFVTIWIGGDKLIDNITVMLLCLNYYLTGMRVSITNLRNAAGVFEKDKWVALAQAIANIVVSIIGVKLWGLPGIYIGTLVSSMLPNIIRPIVVYNNVFNMKSTSYFKTYFLNIVLLILSAIIITILNKAITDVNNYILFAYIAILCVFVPNIIILIVFRKSSQLKYVIDMVKGVFHKIIRKG